MSNFPALDIAIGLAFVYLLLSLICTTVNEMIAGWLSRRAKFLEQGVAALVQDPELKNAIYNHPLIKSLAESADKALPSYIPADAFATALMDIVTGHENSTMDIGAMKDRLSQVGSPGFQRSMRSILDLGQGNPELTKKKIEDWFDQGMDRVSGWYKRNAQKNLLIIGVIVTLVVNADTLHVVNVLWQDPTTRAALVEQAKSRANSQESAPVPMVEYDQPEDPTASKIVSNASSPTAALTDDEKQSINQLTGWTVEWNQRGERGGLWWWVLYELQQHWLGWVLTAIALSMGAPFWFDVLNRFMTIRNAGRAPNEPRAKNTPTPTQPEGATS